MKKMPFLAPVLLLLCVLSLPVYAAGFTWTTLDAPSALGTAASGIYGGNIVGIYMDVSGQHGFLATPATSVPEPSTFMLMILGFAGLGFLKKREKE
jgi:hypothetical protein